MTRPSPDESRSGADVAEAIEVAERGSALDDLHTNAEGTKSGEAPVEQAAGDPEMTEGQVVYGIGGDDEAAAPGASPGPTEESSGVAQSVVGARTSDEVAADEDAPGS